MTSEDSLFKTVLSAIEAGEKERARDLLTRLLRANPNNAEYWIKMSTVVESRRERIFCLKEAHRADSENPTAIRGLTMYGVLPLDEKQIIPLRLQRQNWQKTITNPASRFDRLMVAPGWVQVSVIIGAVLVLAVLIYIGVTRISAINLAFFNHQPAVTPLLPSPYKPTALPTIPQTTATFSGPTPLWLALASTYTPTPQYVNTPHPRTEDYRTGMNAFNRGDWEAALTYFVHAATLEPNAPDLYYHMGEIYRFMGDYSQAFDSYQQAVEMDPNFAPAFLGRALARQEIDPGELENARNDLLNSIQLDPNLAAAYRELSLVEVKMGNPEPAFQALQTAIDLEPDSPLGYLYRAKVELQTGDNESALLDAQHANMSDITLLEAYRVIGQAYSALGKITEAIPAFRTYTMYVPNDVEALTWLGKAYLEDGQKDQTLSIFEQILEINPVDEEILFLRGNIFLEENVGQAALDDFGKILEFDPRSFDANLGAGQAHLLLDENGEAYMILAFCEGLASGDSQLGKVYYWRAQSLEKLDEISAAIKDWQSLLGLPYGSTPETWIDTANQHLAALITLTPTTENTQTVTPTFTRMPTRTFTSTSTRMPTRTATPTRTIIPSSTSTPTPR
jgi:tetratricopeptide (TPR) repeat protein